MSGLYLEWRENYMIKDVEWEVDIRERENINFVELCIVKKGYLLLYFIIGVCWYVDFDVIS